MDGVTAMEALDRVSEAVYDSLRDGPLARDDFHQALRERLPGEDPVGHERRRLSAAGHAREQRTRPCGAA